MVQSKWVKGELRQVTHDWLPGYIFLYSEKRLELNLIRYDVYGIIRCLGLNQSWGILEGEDEAFARLVLAHDGVIGKVKVAELGERVVIDDPLWAGVQGTITRLDRHRQRCCVSFRFDQQVRTVWVGYELLRSVEEEQPERLTEGPQEMH